MKGHQKDNLTDLVQFIQQETKPITANNTPVQTQPIPNQQSVKPGQAITDDGRIVTLGLNRISHK